MLTNILFATDKVKVNEASIVESEVFVYNLGTMFYIDKVLFTTSNSLPATSSEAIITSKPTSAQFTTSADIEAVPDELTEETGSLPDVLFADGTAVTTTDERQTTETTIRTTTQNATIK